MAQRASLILSALLFAGCFPSGEGVDPPAERSVYFPVGLALDPDARHLFIANSDFDLQYNAGTVESWDLEALRNLLPTACATNDDCTADPNLPVCDAVATDGHVASHWCVADIKRPCPFSGEQTPANRLLYPGRCNAIDPGVGHGGFPKVRADSKQIGAFDGLDLPRPSCGRPCRILRATVLAGAR